jgi:hypothetical protein
MSRAALIFTLVILAIVVGPILIIWSLNTLFSLTIPFTPQTWVATAILTSVVRATCK